MPIRSHTLQDADQIADILADGWRAAYSAFMPDELLLPRIDHQHRRVEIGEWLNDDFDPKVEHLLVAETTRIEGFIHIVLEDKVDLGATASINLLYVRPDLFGRGIGRALMAAAAQWLIPRAQGPVILSAYEANPYRGFYVRIGGVEVLRKTVDFSGHQLISVYYRWNSPQALYAATG